MSTWTSKGLALAAALLLAGCAEGFNATRSAPVEVRRMAAGGALPLLGYQAARFTGFFAHFALGREIGRAAVDYGDIPF